MNVLIAVDDSPASEAAVGKAHELFDPLHPEYFVLCVAEDPPPWVADPLGMAVPPAAGQVVHQFGVSSREWASATVDHLVHEGSGGHGIVRQGDPVSEILRAADELDADVIVVGAVERSALRRLIDPSVAHEVGHVSRRPVLLVHAPARR